jgi:hypothetical protein
MEMMAAATAGADEKIDGAAEAWPDMREPDGVPPELKEWETGGDEDAAVANEKPSATVAKSPASPTSPAVDPSVLQNAALVEVLKGLQRLETQREEQKVPAQPEGDPMERILPGVAVDELVNNVVVSDEFLHDLLSGEDAGKAKARLQALIGGVQANAMNGVLNMLRPVLGAIVTEVPKQVQQQASQYAQQQITAQQAAQQIQQDFYGTYPELNKPELLPVVQAVASGKEFSQAQWNSQTRDAIAARVKGLLQVFAGAAGATTNTGQSVRAPAPPPKQFEKQRATGADGGPTEQQKRLDFYFK